MQAARGTSLSDTVPPITDRSPGSRTRLRVLFAIIAAAGLVVDQGTKSLALHRLADGVVEVLGSWFVLHLTRNPGAAFSTGTGYTLLLSLLAIAAALAVLWFSRRIGSPAWAWALGLLLAGITGNLGDRVFRDPGPLRGHVIDFLMLPNWPVFNVADMCINVAAALILVQAFRGVRLDGTREPSRERQA
jgi:signal peptidase II